MQVSIKWLHKRYALPAIGTFLATYALIFAFHKADRPGRIRLQSTKLFPIRDISIDAFLDMLDLETVDLRVGSTQFSYGLMTPMEGGSCAGAEMVVYTMTQPDQDSYYRRQAIREVILAKVRFFIGHSLELEPNLLVPEMLVHRDIVFYNHTDEYRQNYVKWYSMHEYHRRFCPHVRYFVKMDDDVTAMLDRVFQWIDRDFDGTTRNMDDFLLCHVMNNYKPIRNNRSRWYVPYAEFGETKWPPYCYGYFLLTTNSTVQRLHEHMHAMNVVHMDDCFITGLVRRRADVPLVDWPGICSDRREIPYGMCSKDGLPYPLALHNTKSRDMFESWMRVLSEVRCVPEPHEMESLVAFHA